MDIIYLGHASFRIKGRAVVVITDPFDPQKVGLKFPKISADLVTVSHAHDDHSFVQAVSGVKKIIDGPGEYEIAGVSIIGSRTYHDSKNIVVNLEGVIMIRKKIHVNKIFSREIKTQCCALKFEAALVSSRSFKTLSLRGKKSSTHFKRS